MASEWTITKPGEIAELYAELDEKMFEAEELDAAIRENLEVLGYGE